jgi:monofunctional biosynthetic peptidoglycan transglycosylase
VPSNASAEAAAAELSEPLPAAPEYLWEDVPENVLETTVPVHASEPAGAPPTQSDAPTHLAPIVETSEPEIASPVAASDIADEEPAVAEPVPVEVAAEQPSPAPEFIVPTEPQPPAAEPIVPAPVQASVSHVEAAPAWMPARAEVSEPLGVPAAQPEPEKKPRGRVRELLHRGVRIAAIAFAGWACAVVFLVAIFRFVNPPFSMLMAVQFLSGTPIHHQWVPLDQISSNLSRAVIVAEDGRFCQHMGVDFIEMAKAIERATDGYPRGASTISMQVSKNLFLLPVKSYLRKVVEVPLTFIIELAWPKRRILEVYLNIVEWGPGVFGAEAAARSHFNRSAASLTPRQSAQLAVVLPNPIARDAGSPGPRTAQRASIIQSRAARTPEASSCIGR